MSWPAAVITLIYTSFIRIRLETLEISWKSRKLRKSRCKYQKKTNSCIPFRANKWNMGFFEHSRIILSSLLVIRSNVESFESSLTKSLQTDSNYPVLTILSSEKDGWISSSCTSLIRIRFEIFETLLQDLLLVLVSLIRITKITPVFGGLWKKSEAGKEKNRLILKRNLWKRKKNMIFCWK